MTDYIKVPKSELAKLEESRKQIYEFVEKHVDLEDTGVINSTLCELLNCTEQIWKVANIKNWYHLDATDPLIEKSNSSVKELDITFKVNVFDDVDISTDKLYELITGKIPTMIYEEDPIQYYEILGIELKDE